MTGTTKPATTIAWHVPVGSSAVTYDVNPESYQLLPLPIRSESQWIIFWNNTE